MSASGSLLPLCFTWKGDAPSFANRFCRGLLESPGRIRPRPELPCQPFTVHHGIVPGNPRGPAGWGKYEERVSVCRVGVPVWAQGKAMELRETVTGYLAT